jgi:hypothetical protein
MANQKILAAGNYRTLAAVEILGSLASTFLFGAIIVLTGYYALFFSYDRLIIRWIVGISVVAITVQAAGIVLSQWLTFVSVDSGAPAVGTLDLGLKIAICVVPIPVVIVKILFAERCYW